MKSVWRFLVLLCFWPVPTASPQQLWIGAATRTANPKKPAVPSGHMSRVFVPPSEIYSDICTQALAIKDDQGHRIILVTSDVMMIPAEFADRVKTSIRQKYGIPPQAVCIHAIHNHSSPPIWEHEAPAKEFFDPEYAEYFFLQTVGVVGDALDRLASATLRYYEDSCTSVAISRRGRSPESGELGIFPNNLGTVDFRVRVLAADALDGKRKAVLVEYAAHPVVTTMKYLGGEYPSFLRKWLGRVFPDATILFFQGCAGNIRIRLLDQERKNWIEGTPADADRFGHDLSDAAERALQKPGIPVSGPLETKYTEIGVPLASKDRPMTRTLRIQAFRFGARTKYPFIFIGLGAEAFIEYGLRLEASLRPAHTIVVGYANDMAGYLPTADAIREGGYEPNAWNDSWSGLGAPYAPEAESLVINAALSLLKSKH